MESKCPITNLMHGNSIGRLLAFQADPFRFFELYRPEDRSKPVAIKLGFRRFFFCYDPDHAQHILQDQKQKYNKSSLVLSKIKALSGPQGLIQLQGAEALRVRQTSAKLSSGGGMDRLVTKINGFVDELMPIIDQAIARGEAVDLVPHLTRIVLRTAGVFVLNHDLLSESDKLNHAFVDLNRRAGESLRSLATCPFAPAKARSLKVIRDELDRIAELAVTDHEPSLLKALMNRGEAPSFIRDQLKAFLFAGYDTTASSLIFAMYLLAAHPEAQTLIAAETSQESERTFERLRKSAYVQSTYKEALRLYPSAYFLPREANQDDVLAGVKIPRKSQVFLSIRDIQRHPDHFENPNHFIASRFLKEPQHPFSFIPFGGGPRVCIGAELAKLEATLVMQRLCERYEMQAIADHPPAIEALITAHTKSPLPVKFVKRNNHQGVKSA